MSDESKTTRYWVAATNIENTHVRQLIIYCAAGVVKGDSFWYKVGADLIHRPVSWTFNTAHDAVLDERARMVQLAAYYREELAKVDRMLASMELPPKVQRFSEKGIEDES